MHETIIRSYIARITANDVDSFAKKYGITLSETENEVILTHIKKDWRTILYGNPRRILDHLQENMDPFHYQKIEELYLHFKNKYQSYL